MEKSIMANLSDVVVATAGISQSSLNITASSLGVTAASLGVVTGTDNIVKEVSDASRLPYAVPSIYSVNNRGNSMMGNYTWNNTDSWTSYYTYMTGYQPYDAERSFWYALGGYRLQNESQKTWGHAIKRLDWSTNNQSGGSHTHYETYPQNTSYGPFGSRVMFIRNYHPSSSINVSVWGLISTYWSSGYDGAGMQVGIPNTNKYSTATTVNWTNLATYTGGSPTNAGISGTFTLPAQTTAAIVLCNTFYFYTSTGGIYEWDQNNCFYNLQGTFPPNYWIGPDMRMTMAAWTYGDITNNNYTSTIDSYSVWNRAATLYGDR
jgi:hypothetical protein